MSWTCVAQQHELIMYLLKLIIVVATFNLVAAAPVHLPEANERKTCINWPFGQAPNTIELLDPHDFGVETPGLNYNGTHVLAPACQNLQGFDHGYNKMITCDKQIDDGTGLRYESCYQGVRHKSKAYQIGFIQCLSTQREDDGKTHYSGCTVFDKDHYPVPPPRFPLRYNESIIAVSAARAALYRRKDLPFNTGYTSTSCNEETERSLMGFQIRDPRICDPSSQNNPSGHCCFEISKKHDLTTMLCYNTISHEYYLKEGIGYKKWEHYKWQDPKKKCKQRHRRYEDLIQGEERRSTHPHLIPDKPEDSNGSEDREQS